MAPILSICIPTLNRDKLLEVLLENLELEATAYLDKIEIVVADNASTDTTEDIVKNSPLPIIYGKQKSTVGFARNILFATTKLASGKFVWVIGDDDMILPGGVSSVLSSIDTVPDINYHYLNFGWIDYQFRAKVIRDKNTPTPKSLLQHLQFSDTDWKQLERLEDLVFLPGSNPSATFSGMFCFVTRRQYYIDAIATLKPSNSLDGSSVLIDDCFPHAILSLPKVAGKPISYIGKPVLLQGISGWEWKGYAYKNMVFGTFQFFEWLEKTPFAKDAMHLLWNSYYDMAGKLFFRMLHFSEEHQGLDIVLNKAIPFSAHNPIFWDAFMEESRLNLNTEYDAKLLSEWVTELLITNPDAKIGLWGVLGRGRNFVKLSPHLQKNLVWIADRQPELEGTLLNGTDLIINHPNTLQATKLDILVIGARKDFVDEIINFATPIMPPKVTIVSVKGISTTAKNHH